MKAKWSLVGKYTTAVILTIAMGLMGYRYGFYGAICGVAVMAASMGHMGFLFSDEDGEYDDESGKE